MANLNSNTLTLEVELKREDLVYGIRLTNQGKSVFADTEEFLVPFSKGYPLHESIQQSLKRNEPRLWSSYNSLVTVALYPCHATLSDLFLWMTPDGQKWLIDDIGQHECSWEPEEAFTLFISFHAGSFLKRQDQSPGESCFAFAFHTTRLHLESFAQGIAIVQN